MSLVVERARSPWMYALAILLLAPVLTLTVWSMGEVNVGSRPAESAPETTSIAAPGWTQRAWVTSVKRWKGKSRPSPEGVAAAQALVTGLYDEMLLAPQSLATAIQTAFTSQAQAKLAGKEIGWPEGITDVRIKSRRVDIGVQSGEVERAIAHVRISATGVVEGHPIELWHSAQLWMERDGEAWKIFAFDIRRSPLPPSSEKETTTS